MQRTGVRPSSAISLFNAVRAHGCFDIKGVYSHLATADLKDDFFALQQIRDFRKIVFSEPFSSCKFLAHIANSSGVQLYPDSYFSMVRPSLLALGYKHSDVSACFDEIRPCFSLKSKVSYVKVVQKGQGISYGHKYILENTSRIVTVPIGYGDGLRRCLSGKAFCLIRGKKYPIVGSICMDQCMINVGSSEVYVGDEVVFIGEMDGQINHAEEMAKCCDTIIYEVLCGFNTRIPRIYH
jgi:alanine racemase